MKRRSRRWMLAAGTLIIAALAIWLTTLHLQASPLPKPIREQFIGTLMVPQANTVVIDKASATYDAQLKVLVYKIAAYDTTLTVSEQPTPDSFTDIPELLQKVATNMQEYATFDTDIGTVHLAKPTQTDGKQTAIMNSKGTLMFISSKRNLSQDQWRKLFKTMVVIK